MVLTVLAFFLHQVLEYTDTQFQACRKKLGSKVHLWESLRVYIRLLIFESMEHLFRFATDPDHYPVQLKPP